MNLKNLKFENLDNESHIFNHMGSDAKHIQLWTIYRDVKIYNRQLWIEYNGGFMLLNEKYSLDRIKWYDNFIEIQKILKKMGK